MSVLKKVVISANSGKVLTFLGEMERKKEEMRLKAEKRLKERQRSKKQ